MEVSISVYLKTLEVLSGRCSVSKIVMFNYMEIQKSVLKYFAN